MNGQAASMIVQKGEIYLIFVELVERKFSYDFKEFFE